MYTWPDETIRRREQRPRDLLTREGHRDAWDAILAIRRTHRRLEVALDQALGGYGISFGQYRALLLIERNPAYISDAARRLRITRQATDRLYTKLEHSGLVQRTPDAHVVDVEISELGIQRLRKMRPLVRSLVTEPIDDTLDTRQLFVLTELLGAIDEVVHPNASPTWWLGDRA